MKLPDKNELQLYGLISKLHGKNGGVVLNLYNKDNGELQETDYLFVDINGQIVPFFLIHSEIQIRGKQRYVVSFEEVADEEQALELLNREVYLPWRAPTVTSNSLEAASDTDITGFLVTDAEQGFLGYVKAIKQEKMQETLIVEKEGQTILIPLVEAFLEELNEHNKELKVHLPEGLIDLNAEQK